jgi:hypothetical protein
MKIQDSVTKAPTPIPAPAEKLPFSSRPFAEPAAPEVTAAQPNALHYSLRTISLAVQPKLTIGQPNDKYEQEADRVAEKVVQQINAPQFSETGFNNPDPNTTEHGKPKLQLKPIFQRRSTIEGEATPDLESSINRARGGGQSLDSGLQEKMGRAMGADFSRVKVHTDAQSDQLNKSIQAKAFTTGQDVFFRRGAYEPSSRGGQELIAHELTHVIQQDQNKIRRIPIQQGSNENVTIQRKLSPDQIKHANRIRRARGLPLIREEDTEQINNVEEAERINVEQPSNLNNSVEEINDNDNVGLNNNIVEQPNNPPVLQVLQTAPQSIQELAKFASTSCAHWIGNNDILLDILLSPLEANWFKAKACLTMEQWPSSVPEEHRPPHSVGIKLMQALVDMRTHKWKEFTDRIKPEFTERMKMYEDQELKSDVIESQKEKGQGLLNIFDSVGAQAVTSDIDLSTGGSNSELGIQFVNSKFRLEFVSGRIIPYDPGTVFDINLYASDWIHGEAGSLDSGSVRTITPKPEVEKMSVEAEKERTKKMEVWSLVKVRRNMNDKEWASYFAMTLNSLTDESVRDEMEQKLLNADFEYQTFKLRVEAKQKEMEKNLKSQENAFFKGKESAFGHHDEYQEEAHVTRASNAIYEETLTEVKLLRLQINKLKAAENGAVINADEINNLGIQLGSKIAEALTYANEVYATEGAVQHTVLKQGAGKKLEKLKADGKNAHLTRVVYDIKPELWLQSVNENVGDSLHSIEHFKNVPHYAVYRAGKYLSRLCDAAEQLLTAPGAKQAPFCEDLALIGENAVRVKKINVEDMEGDPEYVKNDTFFKDYNDSNLSTVRETIITFGAKIPQLFNEKKRQDEEQQRVAQEQQRLVKEQQKPL